jgi:diguanylate cyclase (GGDEF)-like protein
LLGISPEETLNRPVWETLKLEDPTVLRGAIDAARSDIASARAHTCLVRANAVDGREHRLWVGVRNYASDASVGGLLLTARDVSAVTLDRGVADPQLTRRLELRERLLGLAIHARADFASSLARALQTTAETLEVSAASFWRGSESPQELCCEALFDKRSGRFVRDCVGFAVTAAAHPEHIARLRDRETIIVADARSGRETIVPADWLLDRGLHAAVEVPVLLDGEVKGLLAVHHERPRAWDHDEIDFVATAGVLLGLSIEAAQRQEAESRIEQLAWYDSLTGLPNRNLLRESMRDMIMTAANRRRRIALMLIDLDRFKDVNDTLGHLVGDALIKSAARVLKETVDDLGIVARLGGDEFVVLVTEFKHRQEVALLAARIAQALHRTDLVPNVDTQVSASIGVALFPEHGREMSTLLKNADSAMYQAKRDGRNQFSFFNPIRYELAAREVQLGIQLLKALQGDNAQFVVEYQPQVEIATGRVVGFEALIRWAHPTFGMLTPDRFIGVAEVSGLSERITRWVVNEVCAQLVRWREQRPGFDIPVAINVAGRELGSAALPMIVRSALLKHAIDAHLLTLEITERTLVREGEVNNDVITELASLGVGLSLDDFGTGYSMLGYLKRMPIQSLKIDQSFIEGLPRDADSCAIVHAMLAVARHFRLKVIAEGVETGEQADYLRSIGCEFAQGYYYARALSAQKIMDFVQREPTPRG